MLNTEVRVKIGPFDLEATELLHWFAKRYCGLATHNAQVDFIRSTLQ